MGRRHLKFGCFVSGQRDEPRERDMEDSFDDIFDNQSKTISEPTTEEATPVEPVATEEETTTEETTEATAKEETTEVIQPRNDEGQFASKKKWVPVEALTAERQRREAEATKRAEFEQRIRELEEAASQQKVTPDPFENPDEYNRHVQELVQQQVAEGLRKAEEARAQQAAFEQTKGLYENLTKAVPNYTPEVVQEAIEYARDYAVGDDAWGQDMLASPDPIARILEEKTRHAQQAAEWQEYQRDQQSFLLRKAAELGIAGTQTAPATATNMAATARPTRSIASAGTTAVSTPINATSGEAFDAIFNSKR